EYDDLAHVDAWLEHQKDHLQLVVALPEMAAILHAPVSVRLPGQAQRPNLDWCPGGTDTTQFLVSLH
ncbi:MAG: hypothetical protein WD275_08910, partial [Rhodothermales bacterium]